MACAYCGSGDWEELEAIGISDIKSTYVSIDFLCTCWDCGRHFVTTEYYRAQELWEPRELTLSEKKKFGEFGQ